MSIENSGIDKASRSPDVTPAAPAGEDGVVIGVVHVRIPAHDLNKLAEFYKATFGMHQIGAFLDHAIILNIGKTVEEAVSNPLPRLIVDRRMLSNRDYGINDNNCWCFRTKGMEKILQRAEQNGASIVMQPYPVVSLTSIVVGKFRDPSGNLIELAEAGTDTPERLYLHPPGN